MFARDSHSDVLFTGIWTCRQAKSDPSALMGENHMRFVVSPELWCTTYEPGELWSVEKELMEEGYRQGVDLWGIDLGNEVLQIFADPLEHQLGESGKKNACERRWI